MTSASTKATRLPSRTTQAVAVRTEPVRAAARKLTFISRLTTEARRASRKVTAAVDMAESASAARKPPWTTPAGLANRSAAPIRQTVRPGVDLSTHTSPKVRSQLGGICSRRGVGTVSVEVSFPEGLGSLPAVSPPPAGSSHPEITVVLPAHNEAELLESSVREVVDGLRARARRFEVITVENGSTDDTLAIARRLAAEIPELRVLSLPVADYGRALRAGLLTAEGDVVVNFDVDWCDLSFLDRAVPMVAAPVGPAVVVGSKRAAGSTDSRSPARRIVTAGFSLLLRLGFRLSVSDTHGVKALRRAPLVPLAEQCRFGQDLFDTELVLRAERAKLGTAEIPVEVTERRPARSTMLSRIPRTLRGLARLRLALWRDALPVVGRRTRRLRA